MSRRSGLTGPMLRMHDTVSVDEKVMRYLQSDENAIAAAQYSPHKREEEVVDVSMSRRYQNEEKNRDDLVRGFPGLEEASCSTENSNFRTLRHVKTLESSPHENSPDLPKIQRPKGIYCTTSSSASSSVKLLGSLGGLGHQPATDQANQPPSPVSPTDVRFSWDFSDGGTNSLRNSKEGLPLASLNENQAIPVFEKTHKSSEILSLHGRGVTADSPFFSSRNKFISGSKSMHFSTPKLAGAKADILEPDDHRTDVGFRKPAPYSMLEPGSSSSQYFTSRSRIRTFRESCDSGNSSSSNSPGVNLKDSKRFTKSRGPADAVVEALFSQLVEAKDPSNCLNMAERVLLFQASSLSPQFSALSRTHSNSSGIDHLKLSGAFVQQEISLVKCLGRLQLACERLLPCSGRSGNRQHWDSTVNVKFFSHGSGSIGMGLILMFAWLCPDLNVQIEVCSAVADVGAIIEAASISGLSFCKEAFLRESLASLRGFKLCVLSYVLLKQMAGKGANEWALFWRDMYDATDRHVLIIILDNFATTNDFLTPKHVLATGWECIMLDGVNSEPSAYVAWKE